MEATARWRRVVPEWFALHLCDECQTRLRNKADDHADNPQDHYRVVQVYSQLVGELWDDGDHLLWFRDPVMVRVPPPESKPEAVKPASRSPPEAPSKAEAPPKKARSAKPRKPERATQKAAPRRPKRAARRKTRSRAKPIARRARPSRPKRKSAPRKGGARRRRSR